jgi:hypothetical protein
MIGMIALINSDLIKSNQSTLGWLNPLLYKNSSFFIKDIREGNNKCTAGDEASVVCCDEGFISTDGWDPATGWGSINYFSMHSFILNGTVKEVAPSSNDGSTVHRSVWYNLISVVTSPSSSQSWSSLYVMIVFLLITIVNTNQFCS